MGYWVDDPTGTSPPRYVEGFDPAQGQSTEGGGKHTMYGVGNFMQILDPRKSALPYVLPYAMWAGGAGAAAGTLANPGNTLLPGSLATSTAVPTSSLVAPALVSSVTGAGTAAGASTAATAGLGSGAGAGAGGAGAGAGGAGVGTGAGAVAGGGIGSRILNGVLNQGPQLLKDLSQGAASKANAQELNRAYDDSAATDFNRDRIAATNARTSALNTDIAQREFQSKDYQRNFSNSIRGDMLANMQDFRVTPPPGITMGQTTGGLSLDALPHRQEYGNSARQTAMYNMLHPQELPAIPDAPELTPPIGGPHESASGKTSMGLNIGSRLLDAVLPAITTRRPSVEPNAQTRTPSPASASPQIYAPASDFMSQNASFIDPEPYQRRPLQGMRGATFLPPDRR